MKSFQFELWQECNNICDFCFLGQENRRTKTEVKIQNLNKLLAYLDDKEFISQYDNISLIGGEFFQGQLNDPEVRSLFFKVIERIFEFLSEKHERSSWIAATLTIGDQKDLYEMLDLYTQAKAYKETSMNDNYGLWICTSFDTIGRFHTQQAKENWQYHMKKISEKYPLIKKNVCSILTNDLLEKYNNNEFTFAEFCNTYNTQMFLKQPDHGAFATNREMEEKVPGFFPTRKNGLRFLAKLCQNEPSFISHLMNVNLRSDLLIKNENNGTQIDCERDKNALNEYGDDNIAPCGHSQYYQCYKDSDACIKCDLEVIMKDLGL